MKDGNDNPFKTSLFEAFYGSAALWDHSIGVAGALLNPNSEKEVL
jgi:hypothetical protein